MPPCAECKAPTCWTEKTKLEKILIVSLIFISALALAVSSAYLAAILVGKEKDKEKETKSSKEDNVCLTESCISSAATILENMDSKIPPCENFYNFACGNFVKKTVIPEDQESVSIFSIVEDSLQKQLKLMLEEPIMNELKPFKMIKKFYKTCMNVDLIERDGLNTIRSILKDLGGWPVLEGDKWKESTFDWQELIYKFIEIGFWDNSLFRICVQYHPVYSDRRALYMVVPPSDRKAKNLHKRVWTEEEVKEAYFGYMVESAVQFGADRNRSISELRDAFIFEEKISELSNQTADEPTKTTVSDLEQAFPNFTRMGFIHKLLDSYKINFGSDEKLFVSWKYLKGFEPLLQAVKKRTLANYMFWRFISYCARFLNRPLIEAQLKYKKVFTGITNIKMRWKYCLDDFRAEMDGTIERESLLIAFGALYVRKYFSKKDKTDAQEMVSNIHHSFQDTLEHINWMDTKTREKALDKLKAMIMNIAYPDEFLDDKNLLQFYHDDIELEENYLKSILKLNLFDIRHHFKKLREQPVKRKDWIEQGLVVNVNAFYTPQTNSINVPLGVLQNQMFSNRRPNYLNYGAIGNFIGHEITHGFDNLGRQYDKNGNKANWWTLESDNIFRNKSRCIAEQYSKYKLPELNMTINGTLTLGENIADNGGYVTSYKAYQKWVEKHGTEKTLPGLNYTPNQLFWISLANFYCMKLTPEFLQYALSIDIHSPQSFRVIGSLSNYEEFAKDFHCSVGSKMNPKEKCKLW